MRWLDVIFGANARLGVIEVGSIKGGIDGDGIDVKLAALAQSCKPMMTIDEFQASVPWNCDAWERYPAVRNKELCTCPEPLLSVLEICFHCESVANAMIVDAVNLHQAGMCKRVGCEYNVPQLPIETMPSIELDLTEQHFPARA